jgi:NTE family protein
LVAGRNLIANLRQLTIPVRNITDFDQLPIPFRAIATDFETGDRVVLRGGESRRIRARQHVSPRGVHAGQD